MGGVEGGVQREWKHKDFQDMQACDFGLSCWHVAALSLLSSVLPMPGLHG